MTHSGLRWTHLRWILLFVAFFMHSLAVYQRGPLLGTDQGFQTGAARSLLQGHGVSLPVFEASDVSQPIYKPLYWWPPVYSFMAAGLMATIIDDPWWVTLLLTWLGMVILFAALFATLEMLDLSAITKTALWLYWTFIWPPIIVTDTTGPTDFLAAGFYALGVTFALRSISRQSGDLKWSVLAGAVVGFSAAIRYAYLPLILVAPVAYVVYAFLQRGRRVVYSGALCLLSSVVFTLPTLLWQRAGGASETPAALLKRSEIIVPSLLNIVPFPAMALGLGKSWTPASTDGISLWVVSAVGLAVFVFTCGTHMIQIYRAARTHLPVPDTLCLFYCMGLLTIIVLPLTFAYLSARTPEGSWTFVSETRYYTPTVGFLAVSLFAAANGRYCVRRPSSVLVILFVAIVGIRVGVREVKLWKDRLRAPFPAPGISLTKDYNWLFYTKLGELTSSGEAVGYLSTGKNNFYKGWAIVAGASVYHSMDPIPFNPDTRLDAKRPVTLLVQIDRDGPDARSGVLKELVERPSTAFLGSTRAYDLYRIKLDGSHP